MNWLESASNNPEEKTDIIISIVVLLLFLLGGFSLYHYTSTPLIEEVSEQKLESESKAGALLSTITTAPAFVPTPRQKRKIKRWSTTPSATALEPNGSLRNGNNTSLNKSATDSTLEVFDTLSISTDSTPLVQPENYDSTVVAVIEEPFGLSDEEVIKQKYMPADSLESKGSAPVVKKKAPNKTKQATSEERPTKKTPITSKPKKRPAPKPAPKTNVNSGPCLIMIGAFKVDKNASALARRLTKDGFEVYDGREGSLRNIGIRCPCIGERQALIFSKIKREYNRDAYFINAQ